MVQQKEREEVREMRGIEIANITLTAVMWIATITGNVIIKEAQPDFSMAFFFFSLLNALGITDFAIFYK